MIFYFKSGPTIRGSRDVFEDENTGRLYYLRSLQISDEWKLWTDGKIYEMYTVQEIRSHLFSLGFREITEEAAERLRVME